MPRSARKESGYGIYHVMMRGINRQAIFYDDEDCHRFMYVLVDLLIDFANPVHTLQCSSF